MECLTNDEDRVPRNLLDACVSKGDAMLDQLQAVLESPMTWSDDTIKGLWWLPIHMIHVLGLIPDARAGEMLIRAMVRLWEDDPEHALIEWVSGYWPALFANKPPELLKPMREMIADRNLSSYLRGDLVSVVLAAASRRGADSLDVELDRVASLAADAGEHENFRDLAMLLLLRFPRERHRVQLEDYARTHGGLAGVLFRSDDVAAAFDAQRDDPEWDRYADPWSFYTPERAAQRQQRWLQEDAFADDCDYFDDFDDVPDFNALAADLDLTTTLPYIRALPKTRRNDPCPCGSGKKYKKCCLS